MFNNLIQGPCLPHCYSNRNLCSGIIIGINIVMLLTNKPAKPTVIIY